MSVLENTNGKIKGIKFDINNNIKLFLSFFHILLIYNRR